MRYTTDLWTRQVSSPAAVGMPAWPGKLTKISRKEVMPRFGNGENFKTIDQQINMEEAMKLFES